MKLTIINDYYFRKLPDELLQEIKDTAPGYGITEVEQSCVTVDDLVDSDIVFGRIPPHLLIELPNLKWQHLASAGANGLMDKELYANKSMLLTKSSGTFGIPIAEHIVGMMIALGRDFERYYKKQFEGIWDSEWPILLDVSDSTVLIIGLGDIGTEVSRHLKGFGCRLIGMRKNADKPHGVIKDVRPVSQLHEALPEADYVVICTPGTAETDKLFGNKEFEIMKNTAIIINVGRGMIIDSVALAEALSGRKIHGAGLDVTDPEPLPKGHPLWSAPNILITPHVSAATNVTTGRRARVFINLLKRYVAGLEMYNFIDFEAGY
ncbi:MAG: D-2-hydroxyacid dehydrogenase [Oscillospiraceae bacterium]|nr:D-2-hydroxyacid dehydrogenase [Oscillospiraceae bacterium]